VRTLTLIGRGGTAVAPPLHQPRFRVVIVERDGVLRILLTRWLRAAGFDLLPLAAPIALERMGAVDLLILDDDGVGLLPSLATLAASPHPPSVVLTSAADTSGPLCACCRVVVKPFALDELLQAVLALLPKERPEPPLAGASAPMPPG
jgi:DNA-binding response OmpR family regulator